MWSLWKSLRFSFSKNLSYTLVMHKETMVFFLGILLTILPFLGVPEKWKTYTIVSSGVLLILIGYVLRRSLYLLKIDRGNGERGDDSFTESTQPSLEDLS